MVHSQADQGLENPHRTLLGQAQDVGIGDGVAGSLGAGIIEELAVVADDVQGPGLPRQSGSGEFFLAEFPGLHLVAAVV
jgi:hypothetical protein